jgi:hypothetical protein
MEQKQCAKCGETVDAAKAFCPGCGNPFVEEEVRTKVSEFDASAGTVQYGKTVYNKLLSDMGLNISELKVAPPNAVPATKPDPTETTSQKPAEQVQRGGRSRWIVTFLVLFLVAAALFLIGFSLFVYLRWDALWS